MVSHRKDIMRRVKDDVPLVFFLRPNQAKQRALRGLNWKNKIVAPIHHQNWQRYARGEIDLINLRRSLGKRQAAGFEYRHFEPALERVPGFRPAVEAFPADQTSGSRRPDALGALS